MKAKEIAELLDEPACEHNKKEKSGCSKPKPGATDGGCAFDGAQIALLPIADVAHIVHGPIACAGSSWDNRDTRSSGPELYRIGMTTDLTEQDVIMGRAEKRLFHAIKQAVEDYAPPAVFVYNTCVPVDVAGFYGTKNLGRWWSNPLRQRSGIYQPYLARLTISTFKHGGYWGGQGIMEEGSPRVTVRN